MCALVMVRDHEDYQPSLLRAARIAVNDVNLLVTR